MLDETEYLQLNRIIHTNSQPIKVNQGVRQGCVTSLPF